MITSLHGLFLLLAPAIAKVSTTRLLCREPDRLPYLMVARIVGSHLPVSSNSTTSVHALLVNRDRYLILLLQNASFAKRKHRTSMPPTIRMRAPGISSDSLHYPDLRFGILLLLFSHTRDLPLDPGTFPPYTVRRQG